MHTFFLTLYLFQSFTQAKEKLIEGLQQGSVGGTAGGESSRLEDMKLEKEHIQAQLTSALQQLQNTRRDMQVEMMFLRLCGITDFVAILLNNNYDRLLRRRVHRTWRECWRS